MKNWSLDNEIPFESLTRLKQFSRSGAPYCFAICAPARIRTWNNCFEGNDDIHFTTGAFVALPYNATREKAKTLLWFLHDKAVSYS